MSSVQRSQEAIELRRGSEVQAGALLAGQARVLEMIALDNPIDGIFETLCRLIEDQSPSAMAGVTVLDRPGHTFQAAFFPSISQTFSNAIRGIGTGLPHAGSCAASVSLNETVTCEDVRSGKGYDKDWIALCLAHGINAIQSVPACSSDGTVLGTFVVGFPMPAPAVSWKPDLMKLGAHLAGIAMERDRKRKRQELLIGELRHRMRNVFTVIGSIAYLTFQNGPSSAAPIQTFAGRLKALSKAHILPEEKQDLDTLIRDALEPYRSGHSIKVSGPEIALSFEATQAFGLAVHELSTNAAKYGSLSVPDGSLVVHWIIQSREGVDTLELSWVESQGPEVSMPSKSCFGTTVIERSLSQGVDARVSMDFRPEGLRCTVSAPLDGRLGVPTAVAHT